MPISLQEQLEVFLEPNHNNRHNNLNQLWEVDFSESINLKEVDCLDNSLLTLVVPN